ncbi:hypothetical protein EBF04_25520 [Streptomyces sp. I6]|nr:hypothetical protein EBF04_25520 [Streptomyces sp. I6]
MPGGGGDHLDARRVRAPVAPRRGGRIRRSAAEPCPRSPRPRAPPRPARPGVRAPRPPVHTPPPTRPPRPPANRPRRRVAAGVPARVRWHRRRVAAGVPAAGAPRLRPDARSASVSGRRAQAPALTPRQESLRSRNSPSSYHG